jgi:hypothetical protein
MFNLNHLAETLPDRCEIVNGRANCVIPATLPALPKIV